MSDDEQQRPSKTQRKQKMFELQQLGAKLCELKEADLRKLDLPENLLNTILEAKRLKSPGAMRRQLQYIGKIMRAIDCTGFAAAYQKNHRN